MNVSNDVNPLECVVCYENFNDPYITKCGHTFCKACITDWIEKDPSCPSCRKPVKKTNPNVFARQMVEAAAKKVEESAQPVIAKAKEDAACLNIEDVTDSVAVMQITKSPVVLKKVEEPVQPFVAPIADLAPAMVRKNSLIAVKKVVAAEPVNSAPSGLIAAEVDALRHVKKASPDPVGINIKVFNTATGQIDSFLMPQAKGNVKAVMDAIQTKTLPVQHLKDIGGRAKVYTLIMEPPINVQAFIKSQGNLAVKIPHKTFQTIHGLEFYDGVAMLSTERGDLYYRASDEYREYYLAAATPRALQTVIDRVVMHLLVQPNQLQFQALAPKAKSREEVIQTIQQGLQKQLENPNARLQDVLELESPTEPSKQLYVGVTMDRPTKKPVAREDLGVPITGITTIDKLPEVLKMLGRM